jgi:Arc/MetJ-type ribon-helix-helix transcriptional regulator
VRLALDRLTLRPFLVRCILLPGGFPIAKTKVAVTLDSQTLRRVDRLVRDARYPNRSQAIEAAVAAQLERLEQRRLADECAKLDPAAERAMAEEGLGLDIAGWPEY